MSERGPVLIVDDDHDVRDALCLVLTDCGYAVRAAIDGCAAIDLLRGGFRPRVVLMDLMMPRMDGASLRARLLENPEWAALPVIVLTADRRADAHSVRADATLAKPVDLDELLAALEPYC